MSTKIWTFGTSWKEGDCGLSLNYSDRKEKLLNYCGAHENFLLLGALLNLLKGKSRP
jgi:hypothetical protein